LTGIIPRIKGPNRYLRYPLRAAKWIFVLGMAVVGMSNDTASFAQSQQPQSELHPASISGTVVDPDGAVVANVKVILAQPGITATGGIMTDTPSKREALSDGDGRFIFSDVAAGPFQLSLAASSFAPLEKSGVLHAGEDFVFPQIVLAVARSTVNVEVLVPQEQVAQDEIRVEEKQRLLGVFPNFYVSYIPNAVPLTTKQKFELAWKTTVDPVSLVVTGAVAGIEQADNAFSGYGQGAQGYAKRYGAAYADLVSGTFIGSAILPSLLKQDPRYFYKGTGSRKSRFFYAVANSVICKGDNGHWQPNYSFIIGDLAAGGISNLYYPAQNRNGAGLTFENMGIAVGAGAIGNVVQEFFLRKLTAHAPPPEQAKP
jgi:hypothetical protein